MISIFLFTYNRAYTPCIVISHHVHITTLLNYRPQNNLSTQAKNTL